MSKKEVDHMFKPGRSYSFKKTLLSAERGGVGRSYV